MTSGSLEWWLKSDAGFAVRIAVGVSILAVLATQDLVRHGRAATRWREYAFLAAAASAAAGYGAVNDEITSRISWEYFYYGKNLATVLGPLTPPEPAALHWQAAIVGMKASWSAGLLMGVVLLLANNPRRDRPRLPYARLAIQLPIIAAAAAICGVLLGVVGLEGGLAWMSGDFRMLVRDQLWRPKHMMCAFGIHLGGYVGGILGVAWSTRRILRERAARRLSASSAEQRV